MPDLLHLHRLYVEMLQWMCNDVSQHCKIEWLDLTHTQSQQMFSICQCEDSPEQGPSTDIFRE